MGLRDLYRTWHRGWGHPQYLGDVRHRTHHLDTSPASPEEGLGSPSWLSFVLGEMWEFPPWRVLLGSLGFTGIA